MFFIGRTTIIIAHRLRTIRNAHRIYVLDNGTVIEQGNHETLMKQEEGKYQALIKAQQIEETESDTNEIVSQTQIEEEDEKQSCKSFFFLGANFHIFYLNRETYSSSH